MAFQEVAGDNIPMWYPDQDRDDKEGRKISLEEAQKLGRPLSKEGYFKGIKTITHKGKNLQLLQFLGSDGEWGMWGSKVLVKKITEEVQPGIMTRVTYLGMQENKSGGLDYKGWKVEVDPERRITVNTDAAPAVAAGAAVPSDEDLEAAPAKPAAANAAPVPAAPGPHNDDEEDLPF